MKKSVYFAGFFFISLMLSGCNEKDELSQLMKKYPKKMVEAFYESGMLKAEAYDETKIKGNGRIDFCATPEKNQKAVEEFFIDPLPEADTQFNNECGGMSSAFVMRFYGEQVTGQEIYSQIEGKNPDGTISPKPLKNYWDTKSEYNMYVCKGNIENLKDAVSCNIPVIVLINCPGGWHYVPVVGFDKEYLYIQDSVSGFRNVSGEVYNRKETYEAFEKLWQVILPESDHLMYVATRK